MKWITQSLWVADLMVLAMLAFFILLGGVDLGQSAALAIIVGTLTALGGFHMWRQHRYLQDMTLAPESRRDRERRGF
jgi:hypothetical protein